MLIFDSIAQWSNLFILISKQLIIEISITI